MGGESPIVFSAGGPLANLTEGSAVCSQGGSVVHATVASARAEDPQGDFLPLTVEYRSRSYAFGRIPDYKNRRERHGNDEEILVSRMIDRAVRPLFPSGFVDELQVTVTTHAADGLNDPTVAAVNAASLALLRSRCPWSGPVGCVRVGLINDQLHVNPNLEDMKNSTLDLVYAATKNRPVMIEAVAKEVPDETIARAFALAQEAVVPIIDAQLQSLSESPPARLSGQVQALAPSFIVPPALTQELEQAFLNECSQMFQSCSGLGKRERSSLEGRMRSKITAFVGAHGTFSREHAAVKAMACDAVMYKAFRHAALFGGSQGGGLRVDGRGEREIRVVTCSTDTLPRVHGSSFFQRGDTHVLCTTTLGALRDAKETFPISGAGVSRPNVVIDPKADPERSVSSISSEQVDTFFLHYDFPPFSTGEVGAVNNVNRRMLGHGNLAERALRAVIPSAQDFPYTVRSYAECTSSNGSSSMAAVCGASLALVDAGVPISAHVAGVSVGLVTTDAVEPLSESVATSSEGLRYRLLTDLTGTEDHFGDMDFKVAGTTVGVTALQLDVKLALGVPLDALVAALDRAREGRLSILDKMAQVLPAPRKGAAVELKPSAPRAEVVTYEPERRRLLLGPGGEMVRYIEATYSCNIDMREEGRAYIFGPRADLVLQARNLVQDLVGMVEVGATFLSEVIDIKDFGLLVKINRAQEALLHMSELTHDLNLLRRPLHELVSPGQRLQVVVMSVEKATGLVRVSRKRLIEAGTQPDSLNDPFPAAAAALAKKAAGGAIGDLPSFPTVPPRKWSPEFFRHNIASDKDIEGAVSDKQPDKAEKERPERGDKGSRAERPERGVRPERERADRGPARYVQDKDRERERERDGRGSMRRSGPGPSPSSPSKNPIGDLLGDEQEAPRHKRRYVSNEARDVTDDRRRSSSNSDSRRSNSSGSSSDRRPERGPRGAERGKEGVSEQRLRRPQVVRVPREKKAPETASSDAPALTPTASIAPQVQEGS